MTASVATGVSSTAGSVKLFSTMEKFQRSSSKMLKKMQHKEDFCDVTLASDDYDRIRAHKVVLASASTIFRDMFQTEDKNMEYEVLRMRGVSSKFHGIHG